MRAGWRGAGWSPKACDKDSFGLNVYHHRFIRLYHHPPRWIPLIIVAVAGGSGSCCLH
jgi:hypothetical protein